MSNTSQPENVVAIDAPPTPNVRFVLAPEPCATFFSFYRRYPFKWWQKLFLEWATGILIEQHECENQARLEKHFRNWAAHG